MTDDMGASIQSETPLADWFQARAVSLLDKLFGNDWAHAVWDIIYVAVVAFSFTRPLYELAHKLPSGNLIVGLIIAVLVIFFLVWALAVLPIIIALASHWLLGPPVFAEFGGIERVAFYATLKCAGALSFDFKPADKDQVTEYNWVSSQSMEQPLKYRYLAVVQQRLNTKDEPPGFLEDWSKFWQEKIRSVHTRNSAGETITYGEILDNNSLAFDLELQKFKKVVPAIVSTVLAEQVLIIYLVRLFVDNQINLVVLIQEILIFGVILSLLIFTVHAHQSTEIPLASAGLDPIVPEEVRAPLQERVARLIAHPMVPRKVTITKDYLGSVRDYYALFLFWIGGVMNSVTSLLLLGVTVGMGYILLGTGMSPLLTWYRDAAIFFLVLPFGLIAAYYLAFYTLQNARVLAAPIIVGVLTAGLPFAIGYVFTGKIDLNQTQNTFLAAGGGILTGVVTAITNQVRTSLEGGKSSA